MLGLGFDEVRDVLADDKARELVEVVEELDEDLGRQEAVIREWRARLAPLLAEVRAGRFGLLDAVADEEPDDPRVARAAAELAALLPDDLAVHFPDNEAGGLADAIFADLAPAQSAAVRRAMELVTERQSGPS